MDDLGEYIIANILRKYIVERKVWRHGGYVYKRQTPYLTENEYWCLTHLADTGCVPLCDRIDKYTIQMQDLGKTRPVTDKTLFLMHLPELLYNLKYKGIRHGDLTEYALIVNNNVPYLIDFAESRMWDDPRPDKCPEGDEFWLTQTMNKLCSHL